MNQPTNVYCNEHGLQYESSPCACLLRLTAKYYVRTSAMKAVLLSNEGKFKEIRSLGITSDVLPTLRVPRIESRAGWVAVGDDLLIEPAPDRVDDYYHLASYLHGVPVYVQVKK